MDSFSRAQARHDNSEHPDFYVDDAAIERFESEVIEEARAQIESDHSLLADLLGEQMAPDAIKLLQAGDAIAFAARCNEIIAEAVNDYIGTVIYRVNDAISFGKTDPDDSIGNMVQRAIRGGV